MGERIGISQQIFTPEAMMAFIVVLKEMLVNQLATVFKDSMVDCGAESLSEMEPMLQKMLQEIEQMAIKMISSNS